ncbi:MAG TPA: DUF499 domain-containing protein [Fibrobacteria bacterium]|nr:DUF499 domain-containing protein [Fibrobacteria bacterium]
MHVITESLSNQNYRDLWDLLFDRHPHGKVILGKWTAHPATQTPVPGTALLSEMFAHTPTALILDEFQTWFEGIPQSPDAPRQTWAFNFIQSLSEVAGNFPDRLLLVVSVRDGNTQAYQQLHRVHPIRVDFSGAQSHADRLKLLLHRLFQNRGNIRDSDIVQLLGAHLETLFTVLDTPPVEQEKPRSEFTESWPFSPHLIDLLEEQILVATQAQETRDLIRILVDLYKHRRQDAALITPADLNLENEDSGVSSLLSSVATASHMRLRDKALHNLKTVRESCSKPFEQVPHLNGIVGALWLRSLTFRNAGADSDTLRVDITGTASLDPNRYQAEIDFIRDNSFNIHQEGNRLVFKEEDNPDAKLKAHARNDRLFQDGRDKGRLRKEAIATLTESVPHVKTIVLPETWRTAPWEGLEESENPLGWNGNLIHLALPEALENPGKEIGPWLKSHVPQRRNTPRFLLLKSGSTALFHDLEIQLLARMVALAEEWSTDPQYRKLKTKYQGELRKQLKGKWDRFAILYSWDFGNPASCTMQIEPHHREGGLIAKEVEERIARNLFIPEDFDALAIEASRRQMAVSEFIRELEEPKPGGGTCIAWIGTTPSVERLGSLCAKGKLAIQNRGAQWLQFEPGESEEDAIRRIRPKLPSGRDLREAFLYPPQAIPTTGGSIRPSIPAGISPVVPAPSQLPGGNSSDTPSSSPALPAPGLNPFGVVPGPTRTIRFEPNSPLNLLDRLERERINAGSRLRRVSIQVDDLTGAQLQKLVKDLPDGLRFQLEMDKEEA